MIEYKEFSMTKDNIDKIKTIYASVDWRAYLRNDEKLLRAFANSLFILGAFDQGNLVGFVRCVGDGEHILVVQDLIVDASYQQRGIGTKLFKSIWNKYEDVRMFQVITDLEDLIDNRFYQSFGMKPLADGEMIAYFR